MTTFTIYSLIYNVLVLFVCNFLRYQTLQNLNHDHILQLCLLFETLQAICSFVLMVLLEIEADAEIQSQMVQESGFDY